jgi:hypothetical protein
MSVEKVGFLSTIPVTNLNRIQSCRLHLATVNSTALNNTEVIYSFRIRSRNQHSSETISHLFRCQFHHRGAQKHKKDSEVDNLFMLLGTTRVKAVDRMLMKCQVSISLKFYSRLSYFEAFLYLHFSFEFFWRKNMSEKAASKI